MSPKARAGRRGSGVWASALLAASLVTPAHAQEEIFERGNQLYQEGDYAGAIEAYEAVISAGFDSPDLHYNLGNAYFKAGELGRSILAWERALERAPGDPDIAENLELARSVTADAIEPMPRFWLFSAVSWWVGLLPRGWLIAIVAVGWVGLTGGTILRILARGSEIRQTAGWITIGGGLVVVLLGTNLLVRELGIGEAARGVILAEVVPVRSAPAEDDNLTLFEVHEGTLVRIDQRTGSWVEVVLEDGKVGWVRAEVMEVI